MISEEMKEDKDRSFTDQPVGDPVAKCTTPLKDKRHIWLVQWMRDDYTGVNACDGASQTHELAKYHPFSRNWNTKSATKDEVLGAMKDAKKGDIVVVDAHGSESKGTAVVGIDTRAGKAPTVIRTAEIAGAFKEAAILLLFGCRTGEILDQIVGACPIKLAFGVKSDSGLAVAGATTWLENSRAAEAATTELAMGKKLKWALFSAQAQLTDSKARFDATVVLHPLDVFDLDQSLRGNCLL